MEEIKESKGKDVNPSFEERLSSLFGGMLAMHGNNPFFAVFRIHFTDNGSIKLEVVSTNAEKPQ